MFSEKTAERRNLLLASFAGIGLLPGMPGTFASFLAAAIFYVLYWTSAESAAIVIIVLDLLAVAAVLLVAGWAEKHFKTTDPRSFVLDEVVGQWTTLLFLSPWGHSIFVVAAGFFLFRGFDVAKPFPIGKIEKIGGAWGILLDDLAAAVYSVIVFAALRFVTEAVLPRGALS